MGFCTGFFSTFSVLGNICHRTLQSEASRLKNTTTCFVFSKKPNFTSATVQNCNFLNRYYTSKTRILVLQVLFLSRFTVASRWVQRYLLYYSRIQMFHHSLCPHCMQPRSCFLSSDAVSYTSKYFCARILDPKLCSSEKQNRISLV